MNKKYVKTFQEIIFDLQKYWMRYGCMTVQPYDLEMGAGTSHPMTFFRAIGPEPIFVVYVQPARRPIDSRYGEHSNKLQYYYQFQVVMKPPPNNIQELYLNSLQELGLDCMVHDLKFLEDNWSNPTLGAWGVGWEVWLNGVEITQFTYFQQVGGLSCDPVLVEITYGLERLAISLQGVNSVFDIIWDDSIIGCISYGDLFLQNELEQSKYNLECMNVDFLFTCFNEHEKQVQHLIGLEISLSIPAYEHILKLVHIFNLLDAKKVISVLERQQYIVRICNLTKIVAELYYVSRKKLDFPMCKKYKINES